MKKFLSWLSGIIILILLCSGIFADIVKFFAWLFTLQYSQPETSIAGGIIVRILTFAVSYTLVGLLFNNLGWFDSNAMKIAYFVISTIISFVLAYIIWTIEKYILIIGIVLGTIFISLFVFFVVKMVLAKKKKKGLKNSNE